MTTYSNGRLPASALKTIAPGVQLAKPTANAWTRAVADVKSKGYILRAVDGRGAGYRSYAVQDAMQKASVGNDIAAKRYWNLSTVSTVSLAHAGSSTHGYGTRIDVYSNMPLDQLTSIMKRYGFWREFGSSDPNHWAHDGKTATNLLIAAVKKPAAKAKPKPRKVYVVHSGDTLGHIASKNKLSLRKILSLNPKIRNANLIKVGQKIYIS